VRTTAGPKAGIYVSESRTGGPNSDLIEQLAERLNGRTSMEDVVHPETGEVIVEKNEIITMEKAAAIQKAGVKRVGLRSVMVCESRQGVCAMCYGRDLATGKRVEIGVAVGIIAAQSIGEPGTQLTMRTFHTGGVASANQLTGVANVKRTRAANLNMLYEDAEKGRISLGSEEGHDREKARAVQALLKVAEDQVGGLLRVVELFEARKPKGQAIVTEFGGIVSDITIEGLKRVSIHARLKVADDGKNIKNETAAEDIAHPETGEVIVAKDTDITERSAKKIRDAGIEHILVRKQVLVPYRGELEVKAGDEVEPGTRLTDGPLDPQKVLELQGLRGVQEYLVKEVQNVYKQQGVDINDKHIEVIVRQMLRKRKVVDPGNAEFLQGQLVDRFDIEDQNRKIEARTNGADKPATSVPVLLGITEASLATESFLSAASFQKTTRVLTEAAVRGKRDHLVGLKENVIIGRLIPAGTGLAQYRALEVTGKDGRQLMLETGGRREALALDGFDGVDGDGAGLPVPDTSRRTSDAVAAAAAALGGDLDLANELDGSPAAGGE
jgi:DNA-directed RNA polymerase subunit beta'